MSSRSKGNSTVRRIRKILEDDSWLTDTVEKHGRFIMHKDLFSSFEQEFGFDIIAIKNGKIRLIQAKTNKFAKHTPYEKFAKIHAHENLVIEQWSWFSRQYRRHAGFVIFDYKTTGTVKTDLRNMIEKNKAKKSKGVKDESDKTQQ